jgi:hypothetical protein
MFNLEHAITEWRRHMIAGGIKPSTTLDELENHLREENERQLRGGATDQDAFVIAVQRIGDARLLKDEFKKISRAAIVRERIMIGIASVVIAIGLCLSAVTMYLCQLSRTDRIAASAAVICSVLVICSWKYTVPFLPLIIGTRKRLLTGFGILAGGLGVTTFFVQIVVSHFERSANSDLPGAARWAVFLIAASICFGLGLLMSQPEREHLQMKKTIHGRRMSVSS